MTAAWSAAVAGLMVAFAIACAGLMRGGVPWRLAALPLVGTLAALLLAAIGVAADEPSTIDLALALALLSLPGSLLVAVVEERWL